MALIKCYANKSCESILLPRFSKNNRACCFWSAAAKWQRRRRRRPSAGQRRPLGWRTGWWAAGYQLTLEIWPRRKIPRRSATHILQGTKNKGLPLKTTWAGQHFVLPHINIRRRRTSSRPSMLSSVKWERKTSQRSLTCMQKQLEITQMNCVDQFFFIHFNSRFDFLHLLKGPILCHEKLSWPMFPPQHLCLGKHRRGSFRWYDARPSIKTQIYHWCQNLWSFSSAKLR